MFTVFLSVTTLATAVLHIRAAYQGSLTQVYLFKPATTLLIILIAAIGGASDRPSSSYQLLILAGLGCSLAGDIFLMLPSDRFIPGLISFLFGHLFYITAFVSDAGIASWWWLVPLAVYGAIIYFGYLSSHVGKLRIPVIVYMVVILVMAWQAVGRWSSEGTLGSLFAAAGALLFVISDTVLATNRFRKPFRLAQLLTLGTYYPAQWLIALSIGAA